MTPTTRDALLIELARWAISREPAESVKARLVELLREARAEQERAGKATP